MADSTGKSSSDKEYRQYHPYQNLHVPIQNLYNLPTSPEFLFDEEAVVQHRSWGENLSYYTGTGYLTGAILGGAKGSLQGIKEAERGDSTKLRVNRVLNTGGQAGRKYGNSLGVVGLIFSVLESGTGYYTGNDGVLSTVVAGLGTGAFYKAASGPRSAAVAGAIGGLMAGVAVGVQPLNSKVAYIGWEYDTIHLRAREMFSLWHSHLSLCGRDQRLETPARFCSDETH